MQMTLRKSDWAIFLLVLQGVSVAAEDYAAAPDESLASPESGFDWSQIILPPGTSGDPAYRQHFESYRESLANHSYEEAETAAKRMVELATANAGAGRASRSGALHNLAVAQQVGENYDAAILNYQTAIDIIKDDSNMLSEDLLMPLRGLGAAYLHRQQPEEAFQTYDRALHVSNVNHGPHSLKQQPILNSVMQIYLDQGDVNSAIDILDRIQMLYTRKFPRDSEELLPILYQRAELMDELGRDYPERMALRQIATIIGKNRGESHVDLIDPYMALGRNLTSELNNVLYRSGPHAATAEWYLKQALSIAEENPEADWPTKKMCMLALADYYILVEMHAAARKKYREVWDIMSADESMAGEREADLESLVPVAQPHPYPYANFEYDLEREKIDPDDYLEGTMLVRYTVNDRGRVRNVEFLDATPPEFVRMEWRVRKSLKRFVYRPRLVDGKPVATDNYLYRHDYFYMQSEYQASLEKSHRLNRPVPPKVQ